VLFRSQWVEAGYDSVDARKYVVYQRLKIKSDSSTFTIDTTMSKSRIDASSGFLFSQEAMENHCVNLSMGKFNNNVENTLEAYDGMSPEIRMFAENIRKVPKAFQAEIINSFVKLLCELGRGEIEYDGFCNGLKNEVNYNNINTTLENLTGSDSRWMGILAGRIITYVESEENKKSLLRSIMGVVCPEK